MARLVHERRTSTLSLLYLSIPCVARACACVGTGHRAYLLFLLRSGPWCACFAVAACTHTMLRSAVLTASRSSFALGLVVCLLCSQIPSTLMAYREGEGGGSCGRFLVCGPSTEVLVVYFRFPSPLLVPPSSWRLQRRSKTCAPLPYVALFVLVCVGISPRVLLLPTDLW